MATLGYVILATACLAAQAFPDEPVKYRNTIFGEEKLQGAVFENINVALDNSDVPPISDNNAFRLPTTTKPEHYNIRWTIDMNNFYFLGEVDIDLYATQEEVNEIVIHSNELNITSLELFRDDTEIYQTYVLEPAYHFLRVRLNTGSLEYNADERVLYRLSISFEAPLRTDMYGIYRSWYRDGSSPEIRWMASTQFQATAARSAFPCYDEPSFKAEFDISITRPTAFKSWSCTRQNITLPTDDDNFETDVYYVTPVMSTYLLALIVSQYESQPQYETNSDGEEILKYEVIGRPSALANRQGDYAFYVGQDLLAEMSDHTDLDYYSVHQYLKMTQAAIPDFGAGAMENWGLLTYREAYLMNSPQHTNSNSRQLIAYILSHEIAHMWFGNLVTCDFWSVLWLNEGFARYYQYFLTDWVEDHKGFETRFITEQVHTALLSDSSDNAHPLTNPTVGSPQSVSNMFTVISYNKGAVVIRMTEHLMGFENHRQGLRRYLDTRRFTSAKPIDLFEDLQAVAIETNATSEYGPNFNIVDYYRSWTEQAGHPVLNVFVDHQSGIMTIHQRRFNINSGYATAQRNWIVPINFATASDPDFDNTKPTHIISQSITTIQRESVGDEWVIFNKQQTGFYRVNYDDYTWDLIILLLRGENRTLVHEYNRAQIVDDVFQFARSGLMSYTRAFTILSFMEFETAYAPWLAAISGFNWLSRRVVGTPLETELNNIFLTWAENVISELTYYPSTDEDFMTSYLRYQLAPVMCRLGNEECLEAARDQLAALVTSGQEVPADSRNWVYCNGLRQASTAAEFDFLFERFHTHHVYSEKILILSILGCTRDPVSLNSFLEEIVTEDTEIRPQDYTSAYNSAVSGNEENTMIVFQFIQNNVESVKNAFNGLTVPMSYITARLKTTDEIATFRQWAADNQGELGTEYNTIIAATAVTEGSLQWATQAQVDLSNYINVGNVIPDTSTTAPITTPTPVVMTVAPIVQQSTPDLPASANTSFISTLVIAFAFIVKFIL